MLIDTLVPWESYSGNSVMSKELFIVFVEFELIFCYVTLCEDFISRFVLPKKFVIDFVSSKLHFFMFYYQGQSQKRETWDMEIENIWNILTDKIRIM